MRKYNIDWGKNASPVSIELAALRLAKDGFDTGYPAWKHMYLAACLLFTPKQYARHYWVKRRMKCFCENAEETWIGPGAIAKSTDAAMCVLLTWLSAPHKTSAMVCSTTIPMLEKRIFGEVVKYYRLIPEASRPGKYNKSTHSIILKPDEPGGENPKNGIFGIAVLKGSVDEAVSNIIGVHNDYVTLVIDEMQATPLAAVEAKTNLSSSGLEFKFLGLGNPMSRTDPLGIYSRPLTGWEGLHPDTCGDGWDTKIGRCEFFDGYKSPNIVEKSGKKLYPFLLSREAIDRTARELGHNSPQFWSQRRGFFPPEGIERTMFSESFFLRNGCYRMNAWASDALVIAGVDPAFSEGGDECILKIAYLGKAVETGRFTIMFGETIPIQLSVSDDHTPIAYLIANKVIEICKNRGIPPEHLAIDTTGTQGPLADIIETEWARGIYRVNFGGRATTRRVSVDNETIGTEVYVNRVTELWATMYEFCRFKQVSNLTTDVTNQLSARRFPENRPSHPMMLEPKREMKARTKESPDRGDAACLVAALVKERFDITPGTNIDGSLISMSEGSHWLEEMYDEDVQLEQESYLIGE